MNLFLIPSWYPSPVSPVSGIFTKEQAQAIAEISSDVRVIVSCWGHADGVLNMARPWEWPKRIFWRFSQNHNVVRECNGFYEVFNPKITWSHRLPYGGARQLVDVNRRNFQLAQAAFGKIELIHAHVSYPGGYIAALLSRQFDVPYVLTEHMGPFPFPSLSLDGKPRPEIEFAFTHAAASIAVSSALAQRITSFGYPQPNVIPNMVDERFFSLGESPPGKIVFFTLCNITEQKGIADLLDAIALWNPPAEQFEFHIGGDGPQRESYKNKADTLGIGDRVVWLGPIRREQVPRFFRESDIYVMPSHHETFGVVYAEAAASGKPIIATRCGGPESIVNSSNGLLVDVGDIKGLADAMRSLSEKISSYDPHAIRLDFEQRFSRLAVVSQLLALYNQVLGR
ncbi:glycosyltransferase [Pseudomonas sp.]|uniref:glycosyltransferase n=1 Tax=Pseudomonas sp. TaxID=306 RepID=UPI003D14319E